MLKKSISVLMALSMMLVLLSGCAREYPEIDVPEITGNLENIEVPEPAEDLPWERNIEEHWKVGENGEKLETGTHDFDGSGICSVCRCEIIENSGAHVIYELDQHGNYVCKTFYNSDGKIYDEIISEFKYDENGNRIFEKTYPNPAYRSEDKILPTDSFTAELEYAQDSIGLFYVAKETVTYGDGDSIQEEYIDSHHISSSRYFDAEGKTITEVLYEYSADENGNKYLSEQMEHDCLCGTKYFYGYDSKGNLLYLEELDAEGESVRKETFEYDENGRKTYSTVSNYNVLREESFYKAGETGSFYCFKRIVNNDDGIKIVLLYNENFELISETRYDAEGNLIE